VHVGCGQERGSPGEGSARCQHAPGKHDAEESLLHGCTSCPVLVDGLKGIGDGVEVAQLFEGCLPGFGFGTALGAEIGLGVFEVAGDLGLDVVAVPEWKPQPLRQP
jgi:hypothetical protein